MTSPRDLLNRARWSRGNLHELAVVVIHRGVPGDQRTIAGSQILTIQSGGIELAPEREGAESSFLPYHRFLSIHGPEGELWSRSARPSAPSSEPNDARDPEAGVRELSPSFSVVLPSSGELVIDGSAGEGGGQILRSSLALAICTKRPFAIENIRARRKQPGLKRQHLASVQAAAAIANARVEGATLGSSRLTFEPGRVTGGDFELDIGSAGSAVLVLQTIALPLALAASPSRVVVRGGTHAALAPIFPFLKTAWLPWIRWIGADVSLTLRKAGFYPAGGGEVVMDTLPSGRLLSLHVPESSGELELSLDAVVSHLPESIAQREVAAAREQLGDEELAVRVNKVSSEGPGNAIWLTARDRATDTHNVFSAIGERGISAEQVGRSVAEALARFRASGASVEEHLADQLMLPIAFAREGSYTCSALTLHSLTNIEVIHAFTGLRLRAQQLSASRFRVALERQ